MSHFDWAHVFQLSDHYRTIGAAQQCRDTGEGGGPRRFRPAGTGLAMLRFGIDDIRKVDVASVA